MGARLFPVELDELMWTEFPAQGFAGPACGIIYRAGQAVCGLPLGGIGTGCLDLDTDGTFGRCSIFNTFVPHRELHVPFLSLAVGERVWTLSQPGTPEVEAASEIRYWGHYPIADMEFEVGTPVSVGMRAWCPFIPGDSVVSNTPGAVFEVHLRNQASQTQKGCIIFSFPGPTPEESGARVYEREDLTGVVQGVHITTEGGAGYVLGTFDSAAVRHGAALTEKRSWGNLPHQLPSACNTDAGATVAVDFVLQPQEEKIVRFVLTWYFPRWVGTEWRHYRHNYSQRFSSAVEVATFLAEAHPSLLGRILAWQEAIYEEKTYPIWLREQLVNILHTITEDSFWAVNSVPPEDWCWQFGMFGMTESPRTTPHVAIPSDWYGSLPLVFFFPELLHSLLQGYAHFQLQNGEVPLGLGSGADLGSPIYHFLHTTNGLNYVDLVHRLWSREHDKTVLLEFYPSVKLAIEYAKTLDRDGDGLLDLDPEPTGNQFYGAWRWFGTATHPDGYWLASLKMAEHMADSVGDTSFVNDCRIWHDRGSRSLEEKLWAGEYYLLYHDTATGRRSDTILANQLAGQWLARLHGLLDTFPAERAAATLQTIKRMNVGATEWGALNAIRPDGTVDNTGPTHSTMIFVAENLCLAMTLIYSGDYDTGMEIARRAMHNVVLRQRAAWDMPNQIDPQSGQITHGTDFYQMMILWGLPLAIAGQEIATACAGEHMIGRILRVAKEVGNTDDLAPQ